MKLKIFKSFLPGILYLVPYHLFAVEPVVTGELKQWHKITITVDGPFANEADTAPNPFLDYIMTVTFTHESGAPSYIVPGYFAADGGAAQTSAVSGNKWRAHVSPDKPGNWKYDVSILGGKNIATDDKRMNITSAILHETGSFNIAPSDKTGRDFRSKGLLQYVGRRYLQFAGTGEFFLKAGADSPENLLAYIDFDGTYSAKPEGAERPNEASTAALKTWQSHIRDWCPGDPTWKDDKGKGLIGAMNYLAEKGCNAFSFLTYNAGGDGDDVWPFVARNDKLHYDCSKLDQWQIVFDHAQKLGMYLHFKLQETENDDNYDGKDTMVTESLDGGDLGIERKLYIRELIARFGYELALNWNLGEENTQTSEQQKAMAKFIRNTDPYDHHIVIHTYPDWQDRVYEKLLGNQSVLTGASLQNHWSTVHQRTLKWINESDKSGRPWVVANDEQNPHYTGVPPDSGYMDFIGIARPEHGNVPYTMHDIRKNTLWGGLMAGGAGVEYYFGYQLHQNDLDCEDWRSRDQSWEYCNIALNFFRDNSIPFWDMQSADSLVGNQQNDNSKYCLANPGEIYVVYLPEGGSTILDLGNNHEIFKVQWFNPREGGLLQTGNLEVVEGPGKVSLGEPPADKSEDWVIMVNKSLQINMEVMDNQPEKTSTEPYTWKSVQIVGGGFVDGIVFHQTTQNVCYCRTDMGGAYRRNEKTMRWEPLLDWLSYEDLNLMGVESIALDPSDPDKLYLACGTYTNSRTPDGAILRSNDRGDTFQRTDVPFKMGGNEDGRGNGERLAVDPNNGSILYMGTRHAGLWKSTDRAVTWNRIESFPDVSENPPANIQDPDSLRRWQRQNRGSGIIFVIFVPISGSKGTASSVIYVGVSLINRENLFCSIDAGKTWHPVPGQPLQYRPTHAVLANDGTMYITYGNVPGPSRMTNGGVWKFHTKTGEWNEITPDKPNPQTRAFGYAAVSVDAKNPQILIVSSYNRYQIENGEDIFRSIDGGKTWKQMFGSGAISDNSLAPYTARTGIHWLFDIEIDPFNSDHVIFTTGYGGHETFNMTDMDRNTPTKWSLMSPGIEETVALELLSPPEGAHLISAIGDYGGFVHWDPDIPAPEGNFSNPHFGNTNGLACAENNPNIIVRVGRATNNNPGKNIGFSTDGGKTWQPTDLLPHPESRLGHITVSSDGTTWIWAPDPVRSGYGTARTSQPLPVYFTIDKGKSWTQCKGVPPNTRVVADRVNPKKFYAMNLLDGKLFVSSNRGVNFSEQPLNLPGGILRQVEYRGDLRGGQDRIYATPGREGDLWIAAFDGLYHTSGTALAFSKPDDVHEIHGFGFGKAAPDSNYPSLYLAGVVNGVRGIFRSDNTGQNWIRINDDQHQWGLVLHVTGDPKKYGRVYVGTHGRGILYGDPVSE